MCSYVVYVHCSEQYEMFVFMQTIKMQWYSIYERVPERIDQTGVMKKKNLTPIFLKFTAYSKFESLGMMG